MSFELTTTAEHDVRFDLDSSLVFGEGVMLASNGKSGKFVIPVLRRISAATFLHNTTTGVSVLRRIGAATFPHNTITCVSVLRHIGAAVE